MLPGDRESVPVSVRQSERLPEPFDKEMQRAGSKGTMTWTVQSDNIYNAWTLDALFGRIGITQEKL